MSPEWLNKVNSNTTVLNEYRYSISADYMISWGTSALQGKAHLLNQRKAKIASERVLTKQKLQEFQDSIIGDLSAESILEIFESMEE